MSRALLKSVLNNILTLFAGTGDTTLGHAVFVRLLTIKTGELTKDFRTVITNIITFLSLHSQPPQTVPLLGQCYPDGDVPTAPRKVAGQ